MNILIWVMIGIVGFIILGIGALLLFWWKSRNSSKYPFMIYSADGIHREKVEARVVQSPYDSHKKMFLLRKQYIEIRPPNAYIGSTGIREVTINELNEYSYLKTKGILPKDMTPEEIKKAKANYGLAYLEKMQFDTKKYLEVSLTPEEKSIALFRYKENANRFQNPVNKMQAILFGLTLIMVLMVMIGVIYSTIAYVNVMGDAAELQKETNEGKKIDQQTMRTVAEISKQQIQIIGALEGGDEITRQLT